MKLRTIVRSATALAALVLVGAGGLRAQDGDVLDNLERLAADNGKLYVQPLTQGFGNSMNQGMYHTARVHELLGFDIGIAAAGSFISDDLDTFTPVLPQSIEFNGQTFNDPYESARPTPTASGDGTGEVFRLRSDIRQQIQAANGNPDQFNLQFPDGIDIPGAPFGVIQGSVGLILGTEVSARFIPSVEITEEIGELSAFGLGVKHSVSQYIPLSPVDVAVHAGFQDFDVGDYLSASSNAYGVIVSKKLGPLELVGGGSVESSEIDVDYTFTNDINDEQTTVAFTEDPGSDTRFTIGANLHLLALKLGAQYSVGEFNAVAAKAAISIR